MANDACCLLRKLVLARNSPASASRLTVCALSPSWRAASDVRKILIHVSPPKNKKAGACSGHGVRLKKDRQSKRAVNLLLVTTLLTDCARLNCRSSHPSPLFFGGPLGRPKAISAIGTKKISFASVGIMLPVEGQVSRVPGMLASHSGEFLSFNAWRMLVVLGGPSPSTHAMGKE
jgi:hypothetical protein